MASPFLAEDCTSIGNHVLLGSALCGNQALSSPSMKVSTCSTSARYRSVAQETSRWRKASTVWIWLRWAEWSPSCCRSQILLHWHMSESVTPGPCTCCGIRKGMSLIASINVVESSIYHFKATHPCLEYLKPAAT
jgi:hypothetical protein